jgi:aryl-alcohol dehydrogenase-like predicted oxidoreductase
MYGRGRSETLVGQALGARRKDVFLTSKTGIVIDGPRRGVDCNPASMAETLDATLQRLGTDYLDLYYMHRFDPKVPVADAVGFMARAIEAGKIRAYGVSEWNAAHIREAHAIHPMAAVQPEYSLWTRNVELGVIDACRDLGIAMVCFSPVGRGSLCGNLPEVPVWEEGDIRGGMPRFQADNWPHNLPLLRRFEALAADAGVTPAQLALLWLFSRGEFVHAIPGTTSKAHLEENFATCELSVPQDILDRADELINHQTIRGHRYHDSIKPTIDTEEFEDA